ncbi:MAG: Dinitrogenase iron-molybdenum cofactor [Candidatus Methanofastidiosum methylothiophilum]|jgi:predicted Fe-Mo cluster-binding NifX family protein|uniref:Dinitrogenase iron-molybdenum cofactor n=1 Tax=Candidatus Methanofastidiosum methylothiophilum TaxID=1705564 RepID=A0A150J5P2_9EURY|nr:MAG: Dinitrogenase iron-molybdenum cofactor [Candidatus Methanofastidiosum methylthiophilus]
MKIAVPTDSKGGLSDIIFNHFGMAPTYTVVEIVDNKISNVEIIDNTSDHYGGSESPVELLLKKNVGVVICSNLGPRAMEILREQGFDLFFTKREKVSEVIEKFIKGELERFSSDKSSCNPPKNL